ncbi:hypothetical protein PPERSA_11830 [Pseudocohnilembus persalinus]|uniref:U3 small nucleolar RNA-associated protein 11 n=1 Tax=Pseudocohnilembus persalinus TaxID=266149 RepID=A0A0V0QK53_PSEPJ|nr:hypothetical protein PPERSA_11830 [Pseudocohnilembus persalinus]|eukprot:KRX02490.1 hypothetical protein PPERSA_11830 [Pseudocohnilembus persalinus]
MSSTTFKNIAPKRKYRERAQLESRNGLGLLEKKKDYKQRAVHYHKKEDKMNKLRLKAALKNPDEYYHKMKKSRQTKDGNIQYIDEDSEDENFDVKEYKKILKTQSQNLVKLQKYKDQNKLNNLKAENQFINVGGQSQNTHIIFADNQQKFDNFNLAKHYDTIPELLNNKSNILKKSQLETQILDSDDEETIKQASQKSKANYKKLADTIENEKKMEKLMMKLDYQKNLLGKEKMKLKKYKTGNVHKFFNERKK